MALKTVNVLGFAGAGEQFNVKTRHLEIKISKHPKVAELEGPSPREYALAGYAGCIHAVGNLVARERRLDLKALQVGISAELDTDKFYGIESDNRAGCSLIQVRVKPTADADPETLAAWLHEVEARCPLHDSLVHPTPVRVVLETQPLAVAL